MNNQKQLDKSWLFVQLVLSIAICMSLFQCVYGGEPHVMRASCRVLAGDGGRGSGCVFHDDGQYYYVLTNAHVATTSRASCDFWRAGRQSVRMPADLVFRNHRDGFDVAILRISKSHFGGFVVRPIPLAHPQTQLQAGQQVLTVGCANATWPTLQSGHLRSRDANRVTYVPMPAPGRSGSPLFDSAGERIVGLVAWRSADGNNDGRSTTDGYGIAMPVNVIWQSWQQAGYQTSDL